MAWGACLFAALVRWWWLALGQMGLALCRFRLLGSHEREGLDEVVQRLGARHGVVDTIRWLQTAVVLKPARPARFALVGRVRLLSVSRVASLEEHITQVAHPQARCAPGRRRKAQGDHAEGGQPNPIYRATP